MTVVTLACQKAETANNAFHMVAVWGHDELLGGMLEDARASFSYDESKSILDTTNTRGKSVKDVAMYKRACRNIIESFGGIDVHPPPKDLMRR
eukprot:1767142-Karenia_brevis.AAC.1